MNVRPPVLHHGQLAATGYIVDEAPNWMTCRRSCGRESPWRELHCLEDLDLDFDLDE
ncbi:hypothetical protein [Pseudarthrobacter sp. NamE5]|uniref:hypothetical protein n=1 Tax=Pseudarthrobacter sp. NamE5 TaxID=2576839 RepID=UPI0014867131|nr:hypothetical protein [Pseudarthrobacter sp. NamE5]